MQHRPRPFHIHKWKCWFRKSGGEMPGKERGGEGLKKWKQTERQRRRDGKEREERQTVRRLLLWSRGRTLRLDNTVVSWTPRFESATSATRYKKGSAKEMVSVCLSSSKVWCLFTPFEPDTDMWTQVIVTWTRVNSRRCSDYNLTGQKIKLLETRLELGS